MSAGVVSCCGFQRLLPAADVCFVCMNLMWVYGVRSIAFASVVIEHPCLCINFIAHSYGGVC